MRHGLIQIAMGITKARPAKPLLAYFKTFSLKKASTKAGWNKALDREMVNEVCLLGTTPIEWHCKPGRGRETRGPANLPNCTSLTRFWETNRGCSKAEIRLRETPGVGPCKRYVYRSKGINYFNFIFGLNYIFLCFWVWLCMIKKKKVKVKPRIKLSRNIYIHSLAKRIDHRLRGFVLRNTVIAVPAEPGDESL